MRAFKERGNSNAGGSYVAQGVQQYAIRGIGLLRSPDDIGRIVVATRNGTPVLIRDVARVEIGAVPRLGRVGQDADDDIAEKRKEYASKTKKPFTESMCKKGK